MALGDRLQTNYYEIVAFDYGAVRTTNHQKTLINFLGVELALAVTLVRSALFTGVDGDHEQAKTRATAAADAVRRFLKEVQDEEVRAELDERLLRLDCHIATL